MLEEKQLYGTISLIKDLKYYLDLAIEEKCRAIDNFQNELKNHYIEYNIESVLGDTDYYSYTTACNYLEYYIDEIAEKLKRGEEDEVADAIAERSSMNIDEVINGWTFEETIKTAESLIETEKNMFKWDVIRHLRDFAETYREQLKEYQQLEEQGRLVKLPCKVGDRVYQINENFLEPCTVEVIFLADYKDKDGNCCNMAEIHYDRDDCPYVSEEIYFTDIGKTVFLEKSEAEAKLKELRGGE